MSSLSWNGRWKNCWQPDHRQLHIPGHPGGAKQGIQLYIVSSWWAVHSCTVVAPPLYWVCAWYVWKVRWVFSLLLTMLGVHSFVLSGIWFNFIYSMGNEYLIYEIDGFFTLKCVSHSAIFIAKNVVTEIKRGLNLSLYVPLIQCNLQVWHLEKKNLLNIECM